MNQQDESKILCIDFDDTIHDTHDTRPGYKMGQPEKGAVVALRYLVGRGYTIIVLTGRPVNKPQVYNAVKRWLDYFQVPYSDITNVKPEHYGYIIDNKAMHYDTWERTLLQLTKLENEKAKEGFNHESPGVDTPYF